MLILSCIVLTLCALFGRDIAYQNYTQKYDIKTTPLLSFVFEGIYDQIMPWECLEEPSVPDYLKPLYEIAPQEELADSALLSGTLDVIETAADATVSIEEPETLPTPTEPEIPLGADGLPVVHYRLVDDTYFDDAVFIGDSRTRSLQLYSGLENTTFLADTGLTIYTVLDKKLTPSTDTEKTTVQEYLTEHQFKKVYLMLGINELGTGSAESFGNSYMEVIRTIQELQPDAIIYLQAIMNISQSKEEEHTYINNEEIAERNEVLKTFADNTKIFWLDANSAVCDEDGFLIADYTFDGVHLKAKFVSVWLDWLKSHAVQPRDLPQTEAETAAE